MTEETQAPIIVLTQSSMDEGVFKKPLFVSIKKPLSNIPTVNAVRQGGRWSRSEPNLFSDYNGLRPVVPVLSIIEIDENKENTPVSMKTRSSQISPSTTPTKFLHVLSPSISPNILSPTKLCQKFGNMELSVSASPTKLVAPMTTRLFSERQLEATRNMHRIESEQFVRKLKGLYNEELVEEALTQIRATMSPRQKMILPILKNTSQPELNCLSSRTVSQLIDGKFDKVYTKIIILDCRFEYEYIGGHIKGALNFPNEEDLDRLFMECDQLHNYGENLCLIFHCEFSSHRAPKAYKHLRSWDRKKNESRYPKLFFPEMYLLEGGYKKFYEECPGWCEPRGYVEMKDQSYVNECRLAMISRGRSKSCRKYFSRSCTNIIDDLQNPSLTTFDKRSSPFSGKVRNSPSTDENVDYL